MQDNSSLSTPVFISGCPRSGTTLLGNLVDRSPDVAIFLESFFIPRFYTLQRLYWPLSNVENLRRLAQSITTEESAEANKLTFNDRLIRELPEPTYEHLIDALMLNWAKVQGKTKWGDKSPGYTSKFPLLKKMFPSAKFVHIIRDGRDVFLSLQKLRWVSNPVRAAQMWRKTVDAACEFGKDDVDSQYFEIYYEALTQDPRKELSSLCEFLDIEFSPEMLDSKDGAERNQAFKPWPKVNEEIKRDNYCKWPTQMSVFDQTLFQIAAGHTLEDHDYSSSTDRNAIAILLYPLYWVSAKTSQLLNKIKTAVTLISTQLRNRFFS